MASNADIVRTAVEHFKRTGEFALDVIDPEVEWKTLVESYRGHDGLARWQRELSEGLGSVTTELHELHEVGDAVVTAMSIAGRGQTTGIEGEVRFAAVWRFRDGLLCELVSYRTPDEALRAAEA